LTAASPPEARPLRVVTWNIRAAIGPGEPFPPAWWRYIRRDRFDRIAAFLTSLDADVVTLQEVAILNADGEIHDQPADLTRLTGLHARYGAVHAFPLIEPETGRSIGSASWGNAILTRLPLADAFTIGLPRAADDDLIEPLGADHPLAGVRYGDTEPGHREARCAIGGRLRLGDGSVVGILTTHLTYIGRGQRAAQATACAVLADRTGGLLILTGDFNAPLDSVELEPLSKAFGDALGSVGLGDGDPRRRTCGPSAIDHILTRGITTIVGRVAKEAGDASDHWPVVADLRLDPVSL
jgi:endonuclease/exonuclease/phosphatase family metal-dependent hydrolase